MGLGWVVSSESPFGDDNSAHFAAAVHVAEVLRAGETDFWWHQSNLGIPMFAAYQPLPTLTLGALIALTQGLIEPVVLFKASIVTAWALMPWAWYLGARWYGLSTLFSVLLAFLVFAVQDPFNVGFAIESSTLKGLYTQHFALLFFPVFVGSFRRIFEGKSTHSGIAAALFSLTLMSHLWVGLYAAIAGASLVAVEWRSVRKQLFQLLVFVGLVAIMLAWWLVPLIVYNEYAGGLPWPRETHNGWPWKTTIGEFFSGSVFDFGRWAWLTACVCIGAAGLMFRWRLPHARHWIALTFLTIALFLGRTNWGASYDFLPLHSQVNVMRYLTGIHICGLVAAAGFFTVLVRVLHRRSRRGSNAFVVAVLGSILWAGTTDSRTSFRTFDHEAPVFADLVDYLSAQPDSRIAVHSKLGTGSHFHRDLLPLLSQRGQLQSYAHGYHCTQSTYYAEYFDFSPAAASLFNVGHIVAKRPLPEDFPEAVYSEIWLNEDYAVLRASHGSGNGVFSIVDVRGSIEGPSLRELRSAVRGLSTAAYAHGFLPRIVVSPKLDQVIVRGVDGRPIPWTDLTPTEHLQRLKSEDAPPVGVVLNEFRGLADYTGRVRIEDPKGAWLLLKANAFPWWRAEVDGQAKPIVHVAPNFMAVWIETGTHEVGFYYRNPAIQKAGALLAIVVLLVCLLRPFRLNRWASSVA